MTEPGGAVVRTVLDTGAGRQGLVRRLVEVAPGARFEAAAGPGGELCFVIEGRATLEAQRGGGRRAGVGAERGGGESRARGREEQSGAVALRPDTGLWLPPGARCVVSCDGPDALRLDSVVLPAGPGAGPAAVPLVSELRDCAVEMTGDRRFRVLFGPGNGCAAATQFVGEIPPGRAPLHSHSYDEVVLVLAGEGVLHAGQSARPIAPGSAVHLPPGTPHCLENTGVDTLRVLGVFHPGGSPAAKVTGPAPGTA